MSRLEITNLGPIESADLELGDVTVLVGPPASGKSLVFQMLKLVVDAPFIRRTLSEQGYNWSLESPAGFLELYLGRGYGRVWDISKTHVKWEGKERSIEGMIRKRGGREDSPEHLFLIPAQRVVMFPAGRPVGFQYSDVGDPFVLRWYGEIVRRFMDLPEVVNETLFPSTRRIDQGVITQLAHDLYPNATIRVDSSEQRRRLVMNLNGSDLGYMSWSSGQKEVMPLLMGLYSLLPRGPKPFLDGIQYVVIEEPEMGLHPKAITSIMLSIFYLLSRDYKVVVSSHSHHILYLLWTILEIRKGQNKSKRLSSLRRLFSLSQALGGLKKTLEKLADTGTILKCYALNRTDSTSLTHAVDISTLDPSNESSVISGWGGLAGELEKMEAVILGDFR